MVVYICVGRVLQESDGRVVLGEYRESEGRVYMC